MCVIHHALGSEIARLVKRQRGGAHHDALAHFAVEAVPLGVVAVEALGWV